MREVVFEFIRECQRQEMDYEENALMRLSLIDPNIVSWIKLPVKDLAMMETIPLVAEDMIMRLGASSWIGMDDRQELLKNVNQQIRTISSPCGEMLIQESQKLDSQEFVKTKQRRLQNLNMFVQKLRGMMQQW